MPATPFFGFYPFRQKTFTNACFIDFLSVEKLEHQVPSGYLSPLIRSFSRLDPTTGRALRWNRRLAGRIIANPYGALQPVHGHICAAGLLCEIDHVLVVGEIDGLPALSDPLHQATGRAGAVFVEGFKHIITEERQYGSC